MASVSTHSHPTYFMIDLESPTGQVTLQKFMSQEKNYDLAFCETWQEIIHPSKDFKITNAEKLLKLLDVIQKSSLRHLPALKKVAGEGNYERTHGRADGKNWYGISKNCNTDEQGIVDLLEKIWIAKDDFQLVVLTDDKSKRYIITNKEFILVTNNGENQEILFKNDESNKESLNKIIQIVMPLYHKGDSPDGTFRMLIFRDCKADEREKKAIKIFNTYLEGIKAAEKPKTEESKETKSKVSEATAKLKGSDLEKIKIIALTIRDHMQLHRYYDGNGRSLYLLANLLLHQNKLPMFYPRNMCMFDGNSLDKMIQEIVAGQERFAKMFGNVAQLTVGLNTYSNAVLEIQQIFVNKFSEDAHNSLKIACDDRNFDLLLRQTAQKEKYFVLLEFLLNNKSILNINISAKGEKWGTALDIAKKCKNQKAIELLAKHGIV